MRAEAQDAATIPQNGAHDSRMTRAAVLRGEDWEEYTCFCEELFEELYPDSVLEEIFARRIVDLAWRLRRAGRNQNAAFEALYDQYAAERKSRSAAADAREGVPAEGAPWLGRMLVNDFAGARVLERMLVCERRIENSLYRTLAELRRAQREGKDIRRVAANARGRLDWASGYSPTRDRDEDLNEQSQFGSQGRQTKPIHEGVSRVRPEGQFCKTNPICHGENMSQVLAETALTADSGTGGVGTNKANFPQRGVPGTPIS